MTRITLLVLTAILGLSQMTAIHQASATEVPNHLLTPIFYPKYSNTPRSIYREASQYCPTDPGYYKDGSGTPPGGMFLFGVGGMCTIFTMGLCAGVYVPIAQNIAKSEGEVTEALVKRQTDVITSHRDHANKVCMDYTTNNPVTWEWFDSCVAIGMLAAGDAELNSNPDGATWTDVPRPYDLNSKITQWKRKEGDKVSDYPRYDSLSFTQLVWRIAGFKMCLSDEATLHEVESQGHLTWKQATDLAVKNLNFYSPNTPVRPWQDPDKQ
jgi:hypothetical protein